MRAVVKRPKLLAISEGAVMVQRRMALVVLVGLLTLVAQGAGPAGMPLNSKVPNYLFWGA